MELFRGLLDRSNGDSSPGMGTQRSSKPFSPPPVCATMMGFIAGKITKLIVKGIHAAVERGML